ncbi:patatin-like phospholipase family protein [Prescottella agglutinans]|uniref:Patatin-like phospholipase family protein n=1 Tax=Prescottella agglutinans TaxID=1644129 RepID=A0A438BEU0_9NOCA|nr:patatin-like phospholipase family protein [Prescottella agglutinans]RVW09543.1 patatin-like phospholipase family protein [Prescottella agglutinans]
MQQFPIRSVVLGAGGVVGTAWMAGLATGLRGLGVDLAESDLTVGTSAGAIVGAVLATGRDPSELAEPPRPTSTDVQLPPADPRTIGRVFSILADENLEPDAARQRVGQIALEMSAEHEQVHVERMQKMIGSRHWPDASLLVVAVDARSGKREVFSRFGEAALADAVVASRATPGFYPPMTIGGRRFMDGGMHSATNADLASSARLLIAVHPLAHLFPATELELELREAQPGESVVIRPDERSIAAFGGDLNSRANWRPAFEAGVLQARAEAGRLEQVWVDAS